MTCRPADWRGLLVSVRDAAEARAAVAGGAAIVDVKEPARGPLGAADAAAITAVAAIAAERTPWTVACGELADVDGLGAATRACRRLAGGMPAAAKAGPAGLDLAAWQRRFAAFAAALPADVEPVAVAYADAGRACAPDPAALIAAAASCGSRILLVDTFDKSAPGTLATAAGRARAAEWVAAAREAGLRVAVAGRITLAELPVAVAIGADVVAVRAAVCGGDRLGAVRRDLVAAATLCMRRTRVEGSLVAAVSESRA
jgi:uncharacterized protein (UPF0264 family)